MMSGTPQSVQVSLAERQYDVVIGAGLYASIGDRIRSLLSSDSASRAFVVIDHNVPTAAVESCIESLNRAGFQITRHVCVAAEDEKSVQVATTLLQSIAASGHERQDPVISIGGGIIGDVAGLVASTYRRGVPFIQCPTTLLAMVDASVGGKTAVNLDVNGALLKNMVGTFWQPRLVAADVSLLRSLPDRELRAGVAECLKHGVIDPGDLFAWTLANLPRVHCRDEECLADLVAKNVAVKARIVEADEREEAHDGPHQRAFLNLGHTFAHAIETIRGLSPDGDPANAPLLHGEAVALGLIAATTTASAINLVDGDRVDSIRTAVAQAGLPTAIAGLPDTPEIMARMSHDKKVEGGRLRLVLPTNSGVTVTDQVSKEAIGDGINAIRAD